MTESPKQILPYPKVAASWVKQYDLRFVEGDPDFSGAAQASPANAFSKLWIGDRVPRKIDMLSLMAMSDAFFGRVFHARRELVPFGTVSLTTYFHADTEDLAAEAKQSGRGYTPLGWIASLRSQ